LPSTIKQGLGLIPYKPPCASTNPENTFAHLHVHGQEKGSFRVMCLAPEEGLFCKPKYETNTSLSMGVLFHFCLNLNFSIFLP